VPAYYSEGQHWRHERERRGHELNSRQVHSRVFLCVHRLTKGQKPAPEITVCAVTYSTGGAEPWYCRPAHARQALPVARQPYREPAWRHGPGRADHVSPHRDALHMPPERPTGTEAVTLTRSSRRAATAGRLSSQQSYSRARNIPTFSQRQHCKPTGPTNTLVNTAQPSHLHHPGPSRTMASMKAGVDLLHPAPRTNPIIGFIPPSHITETNLHTCKCTYATRTRPSRIGCSGTRRPTRSPWGVCEGDEGNSS